MTLGACEHAGMPGCSWLFTAKGSTVHSPGRLADTTAACMHCTLELAREAVRLRFVAEGDTERAEWTAEREREATWAKAEYLRRSFLALGPKGLRTAPLSWPEPVPTAVVNLLDDATLQRLRLDYDFWHATFEIVHARASDRTFQSRLSTTWRYGGMRGLREFLASPDSDDVPERLAQGDGSGRDWWVPAAAAEAEEEPAAAAVAEEEPAGDGGAGA